MRLIKKLRSKYVYKEWPDDEWSGTAGYLTRRSWRSPLTFFMYAHDIAVPDSLSYAMRSKLYKLNSSILWSL